MNVHIRENWGSMALDFYVSREQGDGSQALLQYTAEGLKSWLAVPEYSALPYTPTFTIPTQAAHALLGALGRHLGAVEHPEQLRRDYEAERKRVDLFIAHWVGEK